MGWIIVWGNWGKKQIKTFLRGVTPGSAQVFLLALRSEIVPDGGVGIQSGSALPADSQGTIFFFFLHYMFFILINTTLNMIHWSVYTTHNMDYKELH